MPQRGRTPAPPKDGPETTAVEKEARYRLACELLAKPEWIHPTSGTPRYVGVVEHLNEKSSQEHRPGKRIVLKVGTLRDRHQHKHKPAREAHADQQLLTPEQERVLIEWIIFYSLAGRPCTATTVRYKAGLLAGRRPGRNWLPSFLRRNPEVLFRKASNLDPKRAQAFCQPIVHIHYLLLQEWMVLKGIPLENVYNMDEKGCQRGGGKKAALRKYLIPRAKKSQYRRSSENLELVTIIECVCADGSFIWPGFIFAGRNYNEHWFDGDVPPEVTISTTENGWTNDLVGLAWFRENFIPQATQRNTSGKPILLICDGHGSHTTLEFIELAIQNNIILYCLPPHTTHKLQPLDVGVFGPFQTEWVKACDASVETYNTEMPRGDFVHEYLEVRSRTFTPEVIRGAFKRTGIHPFNPDLFTDHDFGPSLATSTAASSVPASFPGGPELPPLPISPDAVEPVEELPYLQIFDTSDGDEELVTALRDLHLDECSEDEAMDIDLPESSRVDGDGSAEDLQDVSMAAPSDPSAATQADGDGAHDNDAAAQVLHVPGGEAQAPGPSGSGLKIRIPSRASRIDELERECERLRSQTIMARSELDSVTEQRKKRNKRSDAPSHSFNPNATILTVGAGKEGAAERAQLREQRRQAKTARAERKHNNSVAQQDRHVRNEVAGIAFEGRLSGFKRERLIDVAAALRLPWEKVTNPLLAESIATHLQANPAVRSSVRYRGLYDKNLPRLRENNNADSPAHHSSQAPLPSSSLSVPSHAGPSRLALASSSPYATQPGGMQYYPPSAIAPPGTMMSPASYPPSLSADLRGAHMSASLPPLPPPSPWPSAVHYPPSGPSASSTTLTVPSSQLPVPPSPAMPSPMPYYPPPSLLYPPPSSTPCPPPPAPYTSYNYAHYMPPYPPNMGHNFPYDTSNLHSHG